MSDEAIVGLTTESRDSSAQQLYSAGTLLRQAREAAGLHVAALAVAMKVPVKKLEALEADRLDLLPDAVFVRALASSVCRALKIDPAPVLSRLPQTATPRLMADHKSINAPFHPSGVSSGAGLNVVLAKPAVLFVLFMLVAALVVTFFPESKQSGPIAEVVESPAKPPEEVPLGVSKPSVEISEEVTPTATISATGSAVAPVAASKEAAPSVNTQPVPVQAPVSVPTPVVAVPVAPSATPVPTSPASVTTPKTAVQAPDPAVAKPVATPVNASSVGGVSPVTAAKTEPVKVTPDAASIVKFKAKSPVWIQVKDSKGIVLVSRNLAASESVGAFGTLPLSVVVGRADAVEVLVRDKPFSLNGVAIENVARFEVK